jgi:hypothetical protein
METIELNKAVALVNLFARAIEAWGARVTSCELTGLAEATVDRDSEGWAVIKVIHFDCHTKIGQVNLWIDWNNEQVMVSPTCRKTGDRLGDYELTYDIK